MTTSARDSRSESKEPSYKIDYPKKINAKDIQDNGLLLKSDDIKKIITRLKSEPEKRFTKKELKDLGLSDNYSIIKDDEKYYVVYKKHVYLGSGGEGRVKVAQFIGQTADLKEDESKDEKKVENKGKEDWAIGKLFALKVTFQYSGLETTLEKEHKMLDILGRAHSKIIKRTKAGFVKHQFLQELLPGENLYEFLQSNKISLKTSVEMMYAALKQMQFLHSKGILHCDIKTPNSIYDPKTGQMTFVDLGIALLMDKDRKGHAESTIGTLGYMAPELNKVYDEKTEIYALGNFFREVLERVELDAKSMEEPIMAAIGKKIKEQMMSRTPSDRPSANELQKFLENLPAKYSPIQVVSVEDRKSIVSFLNILDPTSKGWLIDKVESGKFERLKGESKESVEITYRVPTTTESKGGDYKEKLIKEMSENAENLGVPNDVIELLSKAINRDKSTTLILDDTELLVKLLDAAKKYEDNLTKDSALGVRSRSV